MGSFFCERPVFIDQNWVRLAKRYFCEEPSGFQRGILIGRGEGRGGLRADSSGGVCRFQCHGVGVVVEWILLDPLFRRGPEGELIQSTADSLKEGVGQRRSELSSRLVEERGQVRRQHSLVRK